MRQGLLRSRLAEVALVHFGWLPFFAVVATKEELLPAFLVSVFFLNYAHRHVTLAFVYGDAHVFRERAFVYVLLPLTLVALTALTFRAHALRILMGVSIAWTIYHVLAQKFGFLRIYRATSRAETSRRLEQAFVFGGVLHAAALGLPLHLDVVRRYGLRWLSDPYSQIPHEIALGASVFVVLAYTLLGLALARRWSKSEHRNALYPVYLLSIYASFTCVGLSLVVGYAAFAMSHAIEYLVFTGVYTKRNEGFAPSSLMSFLSRRSWFTLAAIVTVVGLAILHWREVSNETLLYYLAGSSFLHFIYDGWLWKLRNKEVGRVLLAA